MDEHRYLEGVIIMSPDSDIKLYGTSWCPNVRRARSTLEKNGVQYQWIDIELDEEGRKLVEKLNHGNRSVPTIIFPDGSTLVEPSEGQLISKLMEKNI
jgi:glutaredoxin-like protein